jgi:hypothetical protein
MITLSFKIKTAQTLRLSRLRMAYRDITEIVRSAGAPIQGTLVAGCKHHAGKN